MKSLVTLLILCVFASISYAKEFGIGLGISTDLGFNFYFANESKSLDSWLQYGIGIDRAKELDFSDSDAHGDGCASQCHIPDIKGKGERLIVYAMIYPIELDTLQIGSGLVYSSWSVRTTEVVYRFQYLRSEDPVTEDYDTTVDDNFSIPVGVLFQNGGGVDVGFFHDGHKLWINIGFSN